MKRIFTAIAFLLTISVSAQTAKEVDPGSIQDRQSDTTRVIGLEKGGAGSLTFSQTALDNWQGGGLNATSLNGLFTYFTKYTKETGVIFDNNLVVSLGAVKTKGSNSVKSDDLLHWASVYGKEFKNNSKWYKAGIFDLRTQIANGFDADRNKISTTFTPAYILAGVGFQYRPNNKFYLTLLPIAAKFTLIPGRDNITNDYGIEAGKKSRSELGFDAIANYSTTINERISWQSRLEFFGSYTHNPGNIDIFFDNYFIASVTDWLGVTFSVNMMYDDDASTQVQIKQIFGAGLTFKVK